MTLGIDEAAAMRRRKGENGSPPAPGLDKSMSALDISQAAAFLQVRPKTMRSLAAAGLVPAAKVGKFWRFDDTALREWLATRARENVRTCPSIAARIPLSGKSDSRSLAARLDEALAQSTAEPPKSSSKTFAVVTGGRSN